MKQNTPESECHCGVTWVKLTLRAGKIQNGEGDELRFTEDSSLACDSTCGNPWPIQDPSYCSQPRPTSSNKDFETCEKKTVRFYFIYLFFSERKNSIKN